MLLRSQTEKMLMRQAEGHEAYFKQVLKNQDDREFLDHISADVHHTSKTKYFATSTLEVVSELHHK